MYVLTPGCCLKETHTSPGRLLVIWILAGCGLNTEVLLLAVLQ